MNKLSMWLSLLVVSALLAGALPLSAAVAASSITFMPEPQATPDIEIEPQLAAQLEAEGATGYMIYFRERPDLSPAFKMGWEERGRFVVQALQDAAERSQARVRAYLDEQNAEYKSFWIDNVIVVEKSNRTIFDGLKGFLEIKALRARRHPQLIEPVPVEGESASSPTAATDMMAVEPNIAHVGADQVWGTGFDGQGIVVASIDTGVRYTHQALVNHYRGNLGGGSFDHNYNWWDPYNHHLSPDDSDNHGSHTMGIMVGNDGGANQIGMAPGAQWIACQAFNPGATEAGLLECGQFIAAPWNLAHTNPDPDKRPNVVNNSWGSCDQVYEGWYQGVVDSWLAAGIYPVFANGNASNCGYTSPPGLGTVGNPARYGNVTGVGSSGTNNGQYAPHSNWGPTDNLDTVNPRGYADLKPQVLAPGVNIRSSVSTSDAAYARDGWSGTSMSAPHVVGLIALMWQAAPCLVGDYAATETLIEQTATPIPYDDGAGGGPHVPNQAAGWGEVNAVAAVQQALNSCGDSKLRGQVTHAPGEPISGAVIQASSASRLTRSMTANAQGYYTMTLYAGTYTVTATAYGYQTQVVPGILLTTGVTSTLNIQLNPAPMSIVSGTVVDAITGWPLYAHLMIQGEPVNPPAPYGDLWTDPVTGFYSTTLAEGVSYTFGVNTWVAGYNAASRDLPPLTADRTEDFSVTVNAVTCNAPGYQVEVTEFLTETFDSVSPPALPSGWITASVVVTPAGPLGNWVATSNPQHPAMAAPPHSAPNMVYFNSYDARQGSSTLLYRASGLDLSGFSGAATLSFWMFHDDGFYDRADRVQAQVSTDGGTIWKDIGAPVLRYNSVPHWEQHSLDLSTYTGPGMTDVRLGFLGISEYGNDVHLDDVAVRNVPVCIPQPGGLVVGNTFDANTNTPLAGAVVANDSGRSMTTTLTLDPAVDDSFYTLFSPPGSRIFTATMTGGYASVFAASMVTQGETIRLDFALPAGWLAYTPSGLQATLDMGTSTMVPLTLTNTGGAAADWEFQEVDRGFGVLRATPITVPASYPVDNVAGAAAAVSALSSYPKGGTYLDPNPLSSMSKVLLVFADFHDGDPLRTILSSYPDIDGVGTWNAQLTIPTLADLRPYDVVIAWSNVPYVDRIALGDVLADYVDIGGKVILTPFNWSDTYKWGLGGRLADEFYSPFLNINGDNHYSVATLGDHDAGHPIMQGVTAASDYFRDVVDLDPGAELVARWSDGEEFIATKGRVVAINSYSGWFYAWTGDIGIIFHNAVNYLASGQVAWLSESPMTGAVASLATRRITVTLDASAPQITQPGYYHAQLKIKDNTPYFLANIPVTMTVNAPPAWGKLSGSVTTPGYCEVNPALLKYVKISVENGAGISWTVKTDANGVYGVWLDESNSPVTITASLPGYLTQTVTGINITAQVTTTQDLSLRWDAPCINAAPDNLDVRLGIGVSTTALLTLNNSGLGAIPMFTLQEGDYGFAPQAINALPNPWTPIAPNPMPIQRAAGAVVNGKFYIIGGETTAQWPGLIQVYDPATNVWSLSLPAMPAPAANLCAAVIGADIYVIGGFYNGATPTDLRVLHTASGTWETVTTDPLPSGRSGPACASYNGKVYVIGGGHADGFTYYNNTWVYNPAGAAGSRWTTTLAAVPIVSGYGAAMAVGDNIFYAGMRNSAEDLANVYAYHVSNNTWTAYPSLQRARGGAGMWAIGNRLFVGGGGWYKFWSSVEEYDTSLGTGGNWSYTHWLNRGRRMFAWATDPIQGRLFAAAGYGSIGLLVSAEQVNFPRILDAPWLSASPLTGTLGSGASQLISVTLDAGVPQITQTGRYLAALYVMSDDPINSYYAIPVTMTVGYFYDVVLNPPTAAQSDVPGAAVTYTLRVTNRSYVTDTFNMAIHNNAWTTLVTPAVAGPLPVGGSSDVQIVVHIPPDAANGASDTITVTAVSQGDPAQSAATVLTTTAAAVYGVALAPSTDAQSGLPGATVTFTLRLTNTGNTTDTLNLTLADNTWEVHLPVTQTTLAGDTGADMLVRVTLPITAMAGASDSVAVTTVSQGDPAQSAATVLTTTATAVYGVALAPPTDTRSGLPGATVTFTLRLTNTGNTTDTANLTLADNTWEVRLPTTVYTMAGGEWANVEVFVTIPTTATNGMMDLVTVTATSTSGSIASHLTTTAIMATEEHKIYLPIVLKNV